MRRTFASGRLLLLLVLVLLMWTLRASASPVSDKYAQLGGSASFLGSPTTPEAPTPDGIGSYRHYQHGSIYWSPDTGAHEVHGLILERWKALGWERSYLGYPMTDEIDTRNGAGRVSRFQGGELIWRRATNAVSEVKSSDLVIDLPVPEGQAWTVSQANAIGANDSHAGPWVYCYDFIRAGVPKSESNGKAFVAAASAEILYVEDGLGSGGGNNGNVIIQRLGEGRYLSYLHNKRGSYSANFGKDVLLLPQATPGSWPKPKSGTILAEVGDTGTPTGSYHLHFCVTTSPDRAPQFAPFESVPVAFQNYSVSTDAGVTWRAVAQGVPRRGQWLRREPAKPGQSSPRVTASSTIDYGTVKGQVTVGPGTGRPSGPGTLTIGVASDWGEALRTVTISVPANNLTGPWPYTVSHVPAYNNMTVGVRFGGPWNPAAGGGPVGGQTGKFSLAPNASVTRNVQIKATVLR